MLQSPSHDHAPLRFTRTAVLFGSWFFVVAGIWYAAGAAFGLQVRERSLWLATVTVLIATGYYVIQGVASSGGRRWLDIVLNLAQLGATMVLVAAHLSHAVAPRTALGLTGVAAFVHPLVTDWPHIRRWLRTEVASFVPPACLIIDWGLAAMVLATLLLFD